MYFRYYMYVRDCKKIFYTNIIMDFQYANDLTEYLDHGMNVGTPTCG